MTSNLRMLIWVSVLVGWVVLLLDWHDEVVKLRPERARLEQLRAKEQSALWNVDWKSALKDAKLAQSEWLARLPKVEQTGVFRAQALESVADLCKQIGVVCQVGALGENVVAASPGGANSNSSPGTSPALSGGSSGSGSSGLSGLITTGVRVSVPLQDKNLEMLVNAIENGSVLRRIDKAVVRSTRLTLDVQVYGLDARQP